MSKTFDEKVREVADRVSLYRERVARAEHNREVAEKKLEYWLNRKEVILQEMARRNEAKGQAARVGEGE